MWDADQVLLRNLIARVREEVSEVAVVGDDDQPLALAVEAADRVQLDIANRHKVEDGFTPHLVVRGSNDPRRFVQQKIPVAPVVDGHAIDGNFVPVQVGPRPERELRFAVHRHAARKDELLGRAP